ncbi:MAG: heterodisulfide reductase subunit B [Deltaproteobacteria bacterium]|nr:heterodisulfide reductase subunit B [Deltaproteobacteria bacterium]
MKLSYYPGCSLQGTAREYDRSIRAVTSALGIELVELPDWSCCGASSAHMTSPALAVGLAARNLEQAEAAGLDLLVPCAACFQRLRGAALARQGGEGHRHDAAGRDGAAAASIEIIHLTTLLAPPERLAALRRLVARPLTGLRLACYYGCLSLRPPAVTGTTQHEHPEGLDRLVEALGAQPVRWSCKTECCSGSLTMARPDIARSLVGEILAAARRGGAQALVTDCPMCQANLESRQGDPAAPSGGDPAAPSGGAPALPVFFVTELVAGALSAAGGAGHWKEHLIDPRPLLGQLVGWGER